MPKPETRHVCQSCGASFARWVGRCPTCGEWSSLTEEVVSRGASSKAARRAEGGVARPISEIAAHDLAVRLGTGIGELDRVLGGGAVVGGVTLLGGDPGVGKSTLLMQGLAGIAAGDAKRRPVLYVSGEESAGQTAARARRLGGIPETFLVLAENDLDVVLAEIERSRPIAIVIDSVQTVRSPSIESAAGTVSQLREVASRVVDHAKRAGVAAFLVGHVTKDGALAGPKVLEHLVDTVLAFEGERGHSFRTLRAQKNRFGSATEVGVFEMTGEGMREVKSPSALFLSERPRGAAGSVVCATSEGSRPMLVEVQALVSPSVAGGAGRRTVTGTDPSRLALILAVLERKCGLHLATCDVFVNVAGGLRVDEPAVDLAVAVAVASSLRDRPVPPDTVVFGEIGLAGEVRGVSRAASRVAEAGAMGFRRAIFPGRQADAPRDDGALALEPVSTVAGALDGLGLG